MVTATVTLGDRDVGEGHPTYVIAELGINHGGDIDIAARMIAAAASAGADAVKLQTYRTEQRVASDSPIFDVLKNAELDRRAHERLLRIARDENVEFLSTAFDPDSADLLDDLGVSAFKIASFDLVNLELLDHVARKQKPILLSRGMANVQEIDDAVAVVRDHGTDLVLLHCVSAYPLQPADANLSTIGFLKERYGQPVGYSDHTLGSDVAALAVAAGACLIEKHFTMDSTTPGPDHALSVEPEEMKKLVGTLRETEELLGSSEPRLLTAEEGTVPYRRPSPRP